MSVQRRIHILSPAVLTAALIACAVFAATPAKAGSWELTGTPFSFSGEAESASTSSLAIPISEAMDTTSDGFHIVWGLGGEDERVCVYGTATIYFEWVPVDGDSPSGPPSGVNVTVEAGSDVAGADEPLDYPAIYDGFCGDAENYPSNPDYPYYSYMEVEDIWGSYWNPSVATFSNALAVTMTSGTAGYATVNFDVAEPADADNNPNAWDPNPAVQAGASWPCCTDGVDAYSSGVHYELTVDSIE